jgi:hypothetical protein
MIGLKADCLIIEGDRLLAGESIIPWRLPDV